MVFSDYHFNPGDDYYDVEVAIKSGDLGYAREILREIIREHPNAEVWYLWALVTTNPQQRIQFLEKALTLDPEHERARWALAQAKAAANDSPTPTRRQRLFRFFRQDTN